uniref:G protein-coupled receptor 3 n=1 Tax=Taeniopygia guttata TaxID=59729 RepID=H0YRT2_TAEGU|nr:G-protein coupled receptor 3 [Taeniopygia guttata]XP_030146225.1 G-protein coupled receptor 3 [Taeniopygia guttata]XP_030146226.1 G-protein coupled receptor 3 [Taeniopygia guttata]
MMEKEPPNSSEGQQGWFSAGNGSGSSLDLESVVQPLTLNPWDVVLCISGTIISCENAIVVVVIFYTPAFRAPTFLLIGSLATADLLAGVGLILHFAFVYFIPSGAVSLLTVGLLVTSFTASVSSLLSITIDRYLSLYSALTYCSERTVTRTYIMLLLAWGASICHGLLPVMGWNCLGEPWACSIVRPLTKSHLRLLSASVLAVFVAMLQLYVQICRIVCRHAQQIAVQRHCPASSQHLSTHKGIATLAVVLGTFGCCWLPLAVYGLLGDGSSPALYTYATLLPATSNSLLNPLIYAFRNQEIQKVLLGAVCCARLSSPLPFRSPSDV